MYFDNIIIEIEFSSLKVPQSNTPDYKPCISYIFDNIFLILSSFLTYFVQIVTVIEIVMSTKLVNMRN